MVNLSWSQRVADTMESLDQKFSQDELAYLALTSKVEVPIRDRLAYSLHHKFGEENIRVAREWTKHCEIKRVDIAVIDNHVPRLLLELKSFNSFNLFRPNFCRGYPNDVQKDIDKLGDYQPKEPLERIAMILVPNVLDSDPGGLSGIVKYNLWKYGVIEEDELKSAVIKNFGRFNVFAAGRIVGGRAYGIGVNVHYWIFGPY